VSRVTILGTGYIGTSLGLALKAHQPDLEIVGHDREYAKAGEAKKLGAIDRADWNIPSALEGAGLVIIATPIGALERLLSQIGDFLTPGCVVTDTTTLKVPVLGWADQYLRGRVNYVSGHPITGDETPHRKPAATIFVNRTYCVVPAPDASDDAVDQVTRLATAIGARPLFMDPAEHDSYIATVDQLPGLLASTLMSFASKNPAWRDGQRLAGHVFGTATAMALDEPEDRRVALLANRAMLLRAIASLQEELADVARFVEAGSVDELQESLEHARNERAAWQPGVGPQMESPSTEMPRTRDQLSSWFFGGLRRPKR
jgi:prephenate dehydrogenase